jgi:redox-sensitive bicupin YhaK (pirin superfamily)
MKLQARVTEPATGPVIEDRPGRTAAVGPTEVRRVLPTLGRRLVGAWCFADHYGPAPADVGGGIGPHPHAGLQTVSWLVEGEMLHLDSIGVQQLIVPGQLNWMTSGHGIAHAELQPTAGTMLGVQLWVALPDRDRDTTPGFEHHAELPVVDHGAAAVTVMVGEHAGVNHEARTFSPLVGLDVATRGGAVTLPLQPEFEHAALLVRGRAYVAGAPLPIGTLRYLGTRRDALALDGDADARVLVLGGEPLREPVLMWWNFVARTHDEIVEMQRAWNEGQRFGDVRDAGLARIAAPDIGP